MNNEESMNTPAAMAGKAGRPLEVLMLMEPHYLYVNAIRDYLEAFDLFSRHHFTYAAARRRFHFDRIHPEPQDYDRFDVLCIHYSARLAFHEKCFDPDVYEAVEKFPGYKVLFIQDEYDRTGITRQAIRDLGINLVCSCVPPRHLERVYPPEECPGAKFTSILTGYIPPSLERIASTRALADRPYHIVYRGRKMPYVYGDLGFEKIEIGRVVKEACRRRGLPHDIEWAEDRRIYSDAWNRFLQSGRATLGTESGSNVFDMDGSLRRRIEDAIAADPGMGYDEAKARFLVEENLGARMNQISPKFFEFIASRTALILYEGEYSGILEPEKHYLPLRKDHGNLDEILDATEDLPLLEKLTERAYNDIVAGGRFSFRAFAAQIDALLEEAPSAAETQLRFSADTRSPAVLCSLQSRALLDHVTGSIHKQIASLQDKHANFEGMIERRMEKLAKLQAKVPADQLPPAKASVPKTTARTPPSGLRLEYTSAGQPCLNPLHSPAMPRVAILSIPKAGTYLAAGMLDACGYADCGLHIAEKVSSDKRGVADLRRMRTHPAEFLVGVPMKEVLPLVLPGQYFCGHLACSDEARDQLVGFRRLFVCRALREVIISWVRFSGEIAQPAEADKAWLQHPDLRDRLLRWFEIRGSQFHSWISSIAAWHDDADTVTVTYAELTQWKDPLSSADLRQAVASTLEVDMNTLSEAARQALDAPSLTKNPVGSSVNRSWDEQCERYFEELGFAVLEAAIFGAR